jgi:hypothetical protein
LFWLLELLAEFVAFDADFFTAVFLACALREVDFGAAFFFAVDLLFPFVSDDGILD